MFKQQALHVEHKFTNPMFKLWTQNAQTCLQKHNFTKPMFYVQAMEPKCQALRVKTHNYKPYGLQRTICKPYSSVVQESSKSGPDQLTKLLETSWACHATVWRLSGDSQKADYAKQKYNMDFIRKVGLVAQGLQTLQLSCSRILHKAYSSRQRSLQAC